MKMGRRRYNLFIGGIAGAVFWTLVGALLSFAIFLIGEWIFDVNWTEKKVLSLLAWVVGGPAALIFGAFSLSAVLLSANGECLVCQNPRRDCTCCTACEGSGRTDVVAKMHNWFLPEICSVCNGTGNEDASPAEPDDYVCALCGEKSFGKFINVVQLSYIGGPTSAMTAVHEWRKMANMTAFICCKCGKGCANEREAEDKMAPKLSRKGWGMGQFQSPVEGHAGTVYWGQQTWDEQEKTTDSYYDNNDMTYY